MPATTTETVRRVFEATFREYGLPEAIRTDNGPPFAGVGVRNALETKTGGGSFDLGSLLIVLGLVFAIACFSVALVPATYVKWRPAAIFVSERQVDLTVVGLALLVAAAFTFLWRGF